MLTVFPCYAAADKPAAADLARFLEQGANVEIFLGEGEIRPLDNLVAKVAREGAMAEAILLLLSPNSVPPKWDRGEWEPAFRTQPAALGTRVAALLLRECRVPDLLKRADFFDLTAGGVAGFRNVKRWLMGLRPAADHPPFLPARHEAPEAAIEALAQSLADWPGATEVDAPEIALAFARRHAGEFEAVFWLNGRGRSAAALAGDLGEQLGLRLPGPLAEDLERLGRCCAERRCLYLLDGGDAGLDLFGPRASLLRIVPTARPAQGDLTADECLLLAAFSACAPGVEAELAARVAPLSGERAAAALAGLASRGLAVPFDEEGRYTLGCPASPSEETARRHATLARDLAGVRHAWQWALARDWTLARDLGRRAVKLAVAAGRDAEAFELAEALEREAEPRGDRKVLEDSAWERAWILERWGRTDEAQALHRRRAAQYADQMTLDFG